MLNPSRVSEPYKRFTARAIGPGGMKCSGVPFVWAICADCRRQPREVPADYNERRDLISPTISPGAKPASICSAASGSSSVSN
jgi:hypothetical protein